MSDFNDEPRIELWDKDDYFLHYVSQREAFRLLRSGQGDLVLRMPPTVKLLCPTEGHEELLVGFKAGTHKIQHIRGKLYGNYRVIHPEGHVMFHCAAPKILWYLNRDLADILSHDPPQLRLKFVPQGAGWQADDYYLTLKENICVVCGAKEELNRHHVVPHCFRKHAPQHIKNFSHHDVLLLCLACHTKYEQEANKLKDLLGQEHNVSINQPPVQYWRASKAAATIINFGHIIAPERLQVLYQRVKDYIGDDYTQEHLQKLAARNGQSKEYRPEAYGKVIMDNVDYQAFFERWRRHFIDTMNPQFMPNNWSVTRPVVKDN